MSNRFTFWSENHARLKWSDLRISPDSCWPKLAHPLPTNILSSAVLLLADFTVPAVTQGCRSRSLIKQIADLPTLSRVCMSRHCPLRQVPETGMWENTVSHWVLRLSISGIQMDAGPNSDSRLVLITNKQDRSRCRSHRYCRECREAGGNLTVGNIFEYFVEMNFIQCIWFSAGGWGCA